MVVEKSPDWLPDGWIREPKERPDGRKDWYYINLRTGEKFRSKIEVVYYTESGSRMPRQSKRCSRGNEKQMEDLPKWLPTGWSMVMKTRQSGNRVGEEYKCYIAPITGWKFYSKTEVFSHLKTGKPRRRSSEANKSHASEANTSHGSEANKSHASEVNKHHASEANKSHASEANTSHGSEVSKSHASELNERGIGMHSTKSASKVVVERPATEGLPPGWIKEIRITQVAGRTRKDPYYIDPVTGYEFRSKKDVFRYLESGDVRMCKIRPKKRQISDMESIDGEIFQHTAAKTHKIEGNATRRCLFTGESSRLSKAVEDKLVLESSVVKECLPLSGVALDGESSQMISETHQESEGIKNVEGKMVSAENGFVPSPGAEVSPERQSLQKLHSADRESSKLIGAAQKAEGFENTEGKMVCAEKGHFSAPAADGYPGKQPSEKPHDAYGVRSELISAAQESGGLENIEGKMICAEKGHFSAPAADGYPGKQPSEKPHDAYGVRSELISAAQEYGGLENTGRKMVYAEKSIISALAADVSPKKQPSEKPHSVNRESSELVSIAQQESEGSENLENKIVHAENGFISALSATVSPEKQPSVKNLGKRKTKAQLRTTNSQYGKELTMPRRASKRLAGLQAELAPNLEMSERALRMAAKQSLYLEANPATGINTRSCNHLASEQVDPPETTPYTFRGEDQATVEELMRKLENEKQSTEKPESPLVLPFGDSWPDPCLEFAFKTLTGAIPVDDNLVIENYFQQNLNMSKDQSRSGLTLPDLGLDSLCQTGIQFQLGTAEKPTAKQQSPGKPAFTTKGNRGVAASGDGALQQPKGKRSKNC